MSTPKSVKYGIVVTVAALVLIPTTVAAIYYSSYQQEVSANQRLNSELTLALNTYRAISGLYNISLSLDNSTLVLLTNAVANLNTSTPSYKTAAADLSSLWAAYQSLTKATGHQALVYDVNMLVTYGNGTRSWYNDSTAQPGWNGYVVTLVSLKGNVQAVWYPQYGEHLVTGLGGRNQTSTESWFFWVYSNGKWTPSQSGADLLKVYNGTVIAWTLCGYDASFNPACTP